MSGLACMIWSSVRGLRLGWGLKKLVPEGTYSMEDWVLYANNESWNITSKTNDVLYGD